MIIKNITINKNIRKTHNHACLFSSEVQIRLGGVTASTLQNFLTFLTSLNFLMVKLLVDNI